MAKRHQTVLGAVVQGVRGMKTEMDKGSGFGQFLKKPITGVALVMAREGIDGLGIAFELARRSR